MPVRDFLRGLVVAGTMGLGLCAAATAQPTTTLLPPEVETALQRAGVPREAMAVVVQEVGASTSRLSWQAQQPVNPASLMKLVTTAAALDLLGPAWTWNTPVWIQGQNLNGVLEGNLVIKGSGDPKFVQERLWLLLRRLQQLGVREIRGDIVLDRSGFALPPHNAADFDNDPTSPANTGADALLLNFKSVLLTFTPDPPRGLAIVSSEPPLAGVRVDLSVPLSNGPCNDWRGSLRPDFNDPLRIRFAGHYPMACGERWWPVAYADPKAYAGRVIAGLWREMGGRLVGQVREGRAPSDPPNFVVASAALSELIRDINKNSNNVMAQQLFLTLATTQRGGPATVEQARDVVRMWLAERFGEAATRGVVIDNGSGLSRDGRLTAQLLARLLQAAYAGPSMPELMSSLPVSGLDGTMLRSRNITQGRAHLKTGTLRDVVGRAGYVLAHNGRRYVVVAIVHHPNAGAARAALDAVVNWTAGGVILTTPQPVELPPPPTSTPPAASAPAASAASAPALSAPAPAAPDVAPPIAPASAPDVSTPASQAAS